MQSKELAIPKESWMPMLSILFQLIMFSTFLLYVQYANDMIGVAVTTPVTGDNGFYIFFSLLAFTVPILLFLCTICYAKKNLKLLIIPIAITPVSYLLYEVYSITQQDALFLARQWYKVGTSVIVLVLFYLTVNRSKLRTRVPIVASCLFFILCSILMTIFNIGPFVDHIPSFVSDGTYYPKTDVVYMSALMQYGSYMASILFLGLGMTPGGEYQHKQSRRFVALRNMDKIHAINNSRRK